MMAKASGWPGRMAWFRDPGVSKTPPQPHRGPAIFVWVAGQNAPVSSGRRRPRPSHSGSFNLSLKTHDEEFAGR